MKYRREIDGLRAVAVITVIFFHAGFKAFEGGFIGVDVFFVISGYLITTIILSDMNNQKFSIVTFYERRARRILPALFFVMLCCLPFAWIWLLPNHLKDFSESLTAVSLFSSNILFWRESGYFGVASELKPLLHTWSLAVEEQYYVLFPLFLMALWKLRKSSIFGSLMVVGAVSLIAAQWGAYHHPSPTFFLLPTRSWELAIGALIAFYFFYKREHAEFIKSRKKTSEVFGFVGLLMICYSVFAFDKNTPFPSLYALIPTVGTGLIIIFSTSETAVGRFLGIKPMVGMGLISYSTYLWHQPLFVFARHRSLTEPGTTLLLILSASSILLAYISWRFVERPFRDKKVVSRKGVFTFAVAGSLIFTSIGIVGHKADGFVSRYPQEQQIVANYETTYNHSKYMREGSCFLRPEQGYTSFPKSCYDGISEQTSMIWGDSHAASLYYGLNAYHGDLIQITASGCPPIFDADPSQRKECKNINLFAKKIISDKRPQIVYLHANWDLYKKWTGYKDDVIFKQLDNTIKEIKHISPKTKIVMIGSVPQWEKALPEILLNIMVKNGEIDCLTMPDDILSSINDIDNVIKKSAETNKVLYVSPVDLLCENGKCQVVIHEDGDIIPTSWDYGHLTKGASKYLSEKIITVVKQK